MSEPRAPQPPSGAGRPAARPAVRPGAPRPQGVRPAGGSGGSTSGPRAEFVREKKGPPPAVILSLLAAVVVTAGVFGWALFSRKDRQAARTVVVTETDNTGEWKVIQGKIAEARERFRDTMKLRTDDTQRELFQKKLEETVTYISGVREEIDAMLESVRDPATGRLPEEYNGYNHEAKDLVMMLSDLSKATPFGISPEGE